MKKIDRRKFLRAGIGGMCSYALMLSGCEMYSPPPLGGYDIANRNYPNHPSATPGSHPATPHQPKPLPRVVHNVGSLEVISRASWARKGPKLSQANKMKGVSAITVHHDAIMMTKCSYQIAAKRMESIRSGHASHWADIGYHYCIDREGRIWEGRPVGLQGAHVKKHNPHNVGIMVMGHFNNQQPSRQQLDSLTRFLKQLQGKYRVPAKKVFTHRELMPTACPGKHLQNYMVSIRKNRTLV
ncbi:N-acetylmuramoyl-L-alanine amidase [Planctomycetota bacterium]|nr:N-acetylmuramoyl-L-alanine amidase [Planctomycetota bacterium]